MLRRDDNPYGSQSTIDGHMRHTVDIGLSNNFQRGAGYRCSLQDINSNRVSKLLKDQTKNIFFITKSHFCFLKLEQNQPENFFIRNNRYRSTMQPQTNLASNRYQSNVTIGAVTPTLRSRFNQQSLSRGSSQISVNSTNPFEDDYLDMISQIGSPDRNSVRRSGRKKRRAPPPPTSPSNAVSVLTFLYHISAFFCYRI